VLKNISFKSQGRVDWSCLPTVQVRQHAKAVSLGVLEPHFLVTYAWWAPIDQLAMVQFGQHIGYIVSNSQLFPPVLREYCNVWISMPDYESVLSACGIGWMSPTYSIDA